MTGDVVSAGAAAPAQQQTEDSLINGPRQQGAPPQAREDPPAEQIIEK